MENNNTMPRRIAREVRDLTDVENYRSIERLAGALFVDDVLHHHHDATVVDGECGNCGYVMNYYDVIYYTVMTGIHSRDHVKELLRSSPKEILDVTFKDIQCLECRATMDVEIEGYLCAWSTQALGTDVVPTNAAFKPLGLPAN